MQSLPFLSEEVLMSFSLSGFAIRFPRFTGKWREDKGPEDATTVKELLEMYSLQLKQTKKDLAPSV